MTKTKHQHHSARREGKDGAGTSPMKAKWTCGDVLSGDMGRLFWDSLLQDRADLDEKEAQNTTFSSSQIPALTVIGNNAK
jgi:hypothetical protein